MTQPLGVSCALRRVLTVSFPHLHPDAWNEKLSWIRRVEAAAASDPFVGIYNVKLFSLESAIRTFKNPDEHESSLKASSERTLPLQKVLMLRWDPQRSRLGASRPPPCCSLLSWPASTGAGWLKCMHDGRRGSSTSASFYWKQSEGIFCFQSAARWSRPLASRPVGRLEGCFLQDECNIQVWAGGRLTL